MQAQKLYLKATALYAASMLACSKQQPRGSLDSLAALALSANLIEHAPARIHSGKCFGVRFE